VFGFNNLGVVPNPVNWVRKKLAPSMREAAEEKEVKEARQEMAQRGELGVFETERVEKVNAEEPAKTKKKAAVKGTEVRIFSLTPCEGF
jgi:hypothetical protein